MQTSIDYEQIVINNLRQLSPTQQQEVVNFTELAKLAQRAKKVKVHFKPLLVMLLS
jgi:hypothetical protein